MTMKGRCIALARYQHGETDSEAYLMASTSTRRGRVRQGYLWTGEHGERLADMRTCKSAARMIDAAKRSRHFTGIVMLGDSE